MKIYKSTLTLADGGGTQTEYIAAMSAKDCLEKHLLYLDNDVYQFVISSISIMESALPATWDDKTPNHYGVFRGTA